MFLYIILLCIQLSVILSQEIENAEATDPYDTLEVPQTCSSDEIKKAYRKLALKWHPDKNVDQVDEATVKFRKVSEAYDVLSSPEKRSVYDTHGWTGVRHLETTGLHPENNTPVNFRHVPRDPFEVFAEVFKNDDDPISQIFGNILGELSNQMHKKRDTMGDSILSEGGNVVMTGMPLIIGGGGGNPFMSGIPLHKMFHNRRKESRGRNLMNMRSIVIGPNGVMTETTTSDTISEDGHLIHHVEKTERGKDGEMHTEIEDTDKGEFNGGGHNSLLSLFGGGGLGMLGTPMIIPMGNPAVEVGEKSDDEVFGFPFGGPIQMEMESGQTNSGDNMGTVETDSKKRRNLFNALFGH